jgi:hypothetical protein
MRIFMIAAICAAFASTASLAGGNNLVGQRDIVPNKEIALKIAGIILRSVYGDKLIDSEEPLNCDLKNDYWVVTGNLTPSLHGGVAEIHISRKTGEISKLTHGQ